MQTPARGRLTDSAAAPAIGELAETIVLVDGVRIGQILSGELNQAIGYDQDHDEWVVLLQGDADIEMDGERITLGPGDWLYLPRRTPHRLIRAARGTNWLTVDFAGPKNPPGNVPSGGVDPGTSARGSPRDPSTD